MLDCRARRRWPPLWWRGCRTSSSGSCSASFRGRLLPPGGAGQRLPGSRDRSTTWGSTTARRAGALRLALICLFREPRTEPSLPRSSLGWAIDPGGLHRQLSRSGRGSPRCWVTQNGVRDQDDRLRPGYLTDHLDRSGRDGGLGGDVRGYLYWTGFVSSGWRGTRPDSASFAVELHLERRPKPSAEPLRQHLPVASDPVPASTGRV